jgi:hypothetical protein
MVEFCERDDESSDSLSFYETRKCTGGFKKAVTGPHPEPINPLHTITLELSKIHYKFLNSPTNAKHIFHIILIDLITLIMLVEAYSFRVLAVQLSPLYWHYCYLLIK